MHEHHDSEQTTKRCKCNLSCNNRTDFYFRKNEYGRTLGKLLGDYSSSQIKLSGKTKTEHIETVLNVYKHALLLIYPGSINARKAQQIFS